MQTGGGPNDCSAVESFFTSPCSAFQTPFSFSSVHNWVKVSAQLSSVSHTGMASIAGRNPCKNSYLIETIFPTPAWIF